MTAAAAAALLAAGCGSDGSDGGGTGGGSGTVSGAVTFDFVPVVAGAGPGAGLNHAATEVRPARGVTVEFVAGGSVVASTATDDAGRFSLNVPADTTGFLRAKAESVRTSTPSWNFRVLDNTNDDALYSLDGQSFTTGAAGSTRDLHAASGWTGASYGNPRSAGPFAILDALHEGAAYLLDAVPGLALPPYTAHWSPDNTLVDGPIDIAAGELPGTFSSTFEGQTDVYILGNAGDDSDEYDRHVILHEFGHYLEWSFWRSDSLGGPHVIGDKLDIRLAFSEGLGNAFSALSQDDPVYRDSFMFGGESVANWFDIESDTLETPLGWFTEQSVHELVYDLVDGVQDPDTGETVNLDFAVIHDALSGRFSTARAMTSLFSFIMAVLDEAPAEAAMIDELLFAQQIASVTDDYGSGRQNDGGASIATDVLPIYSDLTVNGPAVEVCSTNEFGLDGSGEETLTGVPNKLATRRFVRFTPLSAGVVTIEAVATDIPSGEYADPDFELYAAGQLVLPFGDGTGPPTAACETIDAETWTPSECFESATVNLAEADEYVLDVYEWTNGAFDLPEPFEPIGRTCFNVTVSTP